MRIYKYYSFEEKFNPGTSPLNTAMANGPDQPFGFLKGL